MSKNLFCNVQIVKDDKTYLHLSVLGLTKIIINRYFLINIKTKPKFHTFKMEDARCSSSHDVDTNTQENPNIESSVIGSMPCTYPSASINFPVITPSKSQQFSISEHNEPMINNQIISIGTPGIYTFTKFLSNKCIFEYNHLTPHPDNIDLRNDSNNHVMTPSQSLFSSSDGLFESIEIVIQLDSAVYSIFIRDPNFIQFHKKLHEKFMIIFRNHLADSTYGLLFVLKNAMNYINVLKSIIPKIQDNPIIRSFVLDIMKRTQFRIEHYGEVKPTENTASNQNGNIYF